MGIQYGEKYRRVSITSGAKAREFRDGARGTCSGDAVAFSEQPLPPAEQHSIDGVRRIREKEAFLHGVAIAGVLKLPCSCRLVL